MEDRQRPHGRGAQAILILIVLVLLGGIAVYALPTRPQERVPPGLTVGLQPSPAPTRLGINLFGLATYNRQMVFSNLILQSEWFSSRGSGWTSFPPEQLDAQGWVLFLRPGESAPKLLSLPPAPFRDATARCSYEGRGVIDAGGVAHMRDGVGQSFLLDLKPTGAEDEVAWIELRETDARNPVRNIDCRLVDTLAAERFSPEFLAFAKQFRTIRFLDWQRTNDNLQPLWTTRVTQRHATQSGPGGASIEDMVDLANLTGADPWFLMPYQADAEYVAAFARLVHDRLDSARTVYVELGNEVWNMQFDAAQQAQREGVTLGLGDGDPTRAQMLRYAQKVRETMHVWTDVFGDRRNRLVRVAASQNAWPDLATLIMEDADTAQWVDALATAPYIWLELDGMGAKDVDRIFARVPKAMQETLSGALAHRAIAARHGKRYLTYEGGQHFVTTDMPLARALQRDRRMGGLYRDYLTQWDMRVGGDLILYASTAPIASYGSWGLREYAGQPEEEAPKYAAVRRFLTRGR